MLNMETVIKEMENRGYEVEVVEKISNGVVLKGLMVKRGEFNPVVYVESFIEDGLRKRKTVEEVVSEIENVLHRKTPQFDLKELSNPNFVLERVLIGAQKESTEDLLKRESELEGIEKYLYVDLGQGTFKLYTHHLEIYGLDEEYLWETAEENTNANTIIKSMKEVMAEAYDCEEDELPDCELYVVSNRTKYRGASAVFDKEKLKWLAKRLKAKGFVVLPSSIHEMLLLPFQRRDEIDMGEMSRLVWSVNNFEVDPQERLTNRAYVMEF